MPEGSYVGTELDLFAQATAWKGYIKHQLTDCVRGDVLEVGAGIGANTEILRGLAAGRWVCLEPDRSLTARIPRMTENGSATNEVLTGTLADVPAGERFDTILYLDVLEHIEDDRAELERASERLACKGCLIVVGPAHQSLFSEFDKGIGHHRRYDRAALRLIRPANLRERRLVYLDSLGLLASVANRVLLRSPMPTPGQIRFWDKVLVGGSRVLDVVLGHRVGKSILAVWER